jgi:hypothetical protein
MEMTKQDAAELLKTFESEKNLDATFLDKPAILDNFKAAAGVTNAALEFVKAKCIAGADVFETCTATDKFIEE